MKIFKNKLLIVTLLLLNFFTSRAQDVEISGSCITNTNTLVLGGDASNTTYNGNPVYYNGTLPVDYQGNAITTNLYLYYALASELGTPENRWVVAYGGQPYYYYISNATSAPLGQYLPFDTNATVTDCGGSVTISLLCTSFTTPLFDSIASICSGASLNDLPTMSNNSYSGTWSPAIDNTATTTYTFTPDNEQCATTASLTITVNQPVTPTFTAVAPICNGDLLTDLPTTSDDSYLGTWLPALDNTETTTYTFTPDSGQCATEASLTITVNQPVTPTFTAVDPICYGDVLTDLPTTSDNSYSGTWLPALNNIETTTYTFTPDSRQCATETSLTINVNTANEPTGDSIQTFPVVDANDATIASIVINPTNVIWYASLVDAQNGDSPLDPSTVLATGSTYYAVNVVGACSSTPFAVTVTVTLGNDEFNNLNFAYYPNPTSTVVNISYSSKITQVTLINLLGQTLMTEKTNATEVQVDLSRLAEAAYFIKVTSDDKEKVIKVIKQR